VTSRSQEKSNPSSQKENKGKRNLRAGAGSSHETFAGKPDEFLLLDGM